MKTISIKSIGLKFLGLFEFWLWLNIQKWNPEIDRFEYKSYDLYSGGETLRYQKIIQKFTESDLSEEKFIWSFIIPRIFRIDFIEP